MAKFATLASDFSATSLPAAFYLAGPGASYGGGRVTLDNPNTVDTSSVQTSVTYDLTDSQIACEAPFVGGNGGLNEQSLFCLSAGDAFSTTNSIRFFRFGGFGMTARQTVAGVTTDLAQWSYSPAVHRWMRIRHASGVTYWETSPDGAHWTVQAQGTPGITLTALYASWRTFRFGAEAGTTVGLTVEGINTVPPAPATSVAPAEPRLFVAMDTGPMETGIVVGDDGTMEATPPSWSATTGSTTGLAGPGYAGYQALTVTRTSTTGPAGAQYRSAAGSIRPGGAYLMWIIGTTTGTDRAGTISYTWHDSADLQIGPGVARAVAEGQGYVRHEREDWTWWGLIDTAPAGADHLRARIDLGAVPTAELHRLDTFSIHYLGTEVTDRLKSWKWARGRNSVRDQVEASKASFTLLNEDGWVTPDATTDAAGDPIPAPYLGGVDVDRRIVLVAEIDGVPYPRWAGTIGEIEQGTIRESDGGSYSTVELRCTDGTRVLTKKPLYPPFRAIILQDRPDSYLPLGEAAGTTQAADLAGAALAAPLRSAAGGSGGSAFGAASILPVVAAGRTADDNSTTLQFNPAIPLGDGGDVLDVSALPGAMPTTAGWTMAVLVQPGENGLLGNTEVIFRQSINSGSAQFIAGFQLELTDASPRVVTGSSEIIGSVFSYAQEIPRWLSVTFEPDVGTWGRVVLRTGVETITKTLVSDPFPNGEPTHAFLGGVYNPVTSAGSFMWTRRMAHVAFWERVVDDERLAQHNEEISGAGIVFESFRHRRILAMGGWPLVDTRVDVGVSLLLPDAWPKTTLVAQLQKNATSTGAITYQDAADRSVLRIRHYRMNKAPVATLSHAGGTPVAVENYGPIKDESGIENVVTVTVTGGTSYTAADPDSRDRHGDIEGSGTLEVATDSEGQAAAQWRVLARKDGRVRVGNLVAKSSLYPALLPVMFAAELGDRLLVEDLPQVGPATELDVFVERMEETATAMPLSITHTLQLSAVTEVYSGVAIYDDPGSTYDSGVTYTY